MKTALISSTPSAARPSRSSANRLAACGSVCADPGQTAISVQDTAYGPSMCLAEDDYHAERPKTVKRRATHRGYASASVYCTPPRRAPPAP